MPFGGAELDRNVTYQIKCNRNANMLECKQHLFRVICWQVAMILRMKENETSDLYKSIGM